MAKPRKEKSIWRENLESIVIAIVLAVLMRQFVVQAFKIPSGSMEETLQVGDHILVNKFLYRFTSPKRADVIVFKYPWDNNRDYIKRIAALPGDQVEIRGDQVLVNGRGLEEPYVVLKGQRHRLPDPFGPLPVPKKGDEVEIRADLRLYINGKPVAVPDTGFQPRSRFGMLSSLQTFYGALFPKTNARLDRPVKPFKVDQDYYFALGDNRYNSQDSRYWGFVKADRIKGKAFFIYWSWDCSEARGREWFRHVDCAIKLAKHVRWDRLGRLINLTPPSHAASRE